MISNSRWYGAPVDALAVWSVTSTESAATVLPLNFLPTLSGTSSLPKGAVPLLTRSGIARLDALTVTVFLPFFLAAATPPDVRPTVTLSASAITPASARRERLLLIFTPSPLEVGAPRRLPARPTVGLTLLSRGVTYRPLGFTNMCSVL